MLSLPSQADAMVTRTTVCFLRYGVDVDRWRESKMYIKCDEEGCRCGLNPTNIWRRGMRWKPEDGRGFQHTFSSKQAVSDVLFSHGNQPLASRLCKKRDKIP